jgi:cyclic pyranopterin phosphate synthase
VQVKDFFVTDKRGTVDMLIDASGRSIDYLRLSVTDRCDLRCAYCLPEKFGDYAEPADWLGFDEIERLVAVFAARGLRHIRLTGGEPLLRRGLPALAQRLAVLPGIDDLSLSTNGTRLAAQAAAIRRAGVGELRHPRAYADSQRTRRREHRGTHAHVGR